MSVWARFSLPRVGALFPSVCGRAFPLRAQEYRKFDFHSPWDQLEGGAKSKNQV